MLRLVKQETSFTSQTTVEMLCFDLDNTTACIEIINANFADQAKRADLWQRVSVKCLERRLDKSAFKYFWETVTR